ncbi:MAG: DarT ssDNA thymidine ADP-ribosyltransferase family protein [Bacteroides sp.]
MNNEYKDDYKDFQREISNRGIEYLVHFTTTRNLSDILKIEKIISRQQLDELRKFNIDISDYAITSDAYRLDGKENINLSIQRTNKSFFKKVIIEKNSDPSVTWCVLKIEPKYIYLKSTRFSITNAANSDNRYNGGIGESIEIFRKMFEERLVVKTQNGTRVYVRNDQTPQNYTTDEQAEVLVVEPIPIDDILKVCFRDEEALNDTLSSLRVKGINWHPERFEVDNQLFPL